MRNVWRLPVLLVFCLLLTAAHAQQEVDSLRRLLSAGVSATDEPRIYLALANQYLKIDIDSSMYFSSIAEEKAIVQSDSLSLARCFAIRGDGYQLRSEFEKSSENFRKAIAISEKTGNDALLGSCFNGMGMNYYYLSDLDKSEAYILKAAEAKLKAEEYVYYSAILTNLATIYFHREKYDEAILILTKAEKVLKLNGKEQFLPSIYNTLGAIYKQSRANPDSAAYYYQKSIDLAKSQKIYDNVVTGYHNLGQLYYEQKNYAQAIAYTKIAEAEFKETTNVKYRLGVYELLSKIYEDAGELRKALEYQKKESELNQEVFQIEKQKAIDEMEIKYQTAQKQNEIQLQKEEIEAQNYQADRARNRYIVLLLSGLIVFVILVFLLVINELRKRQAQKLEREKRKIFENIVHEIRSPVTLIQGPVEALKKATDDPRVKTHLVLLERNVDKLMLLVNELIDASKIDQNQYSAVLDTGEISLFIEGVLAQFHALAQAKKMRLSHQSTIAKGTYHAFHSAILEKIVSNLVGNAVKYCLENSEVWLYSAVEENRLILVVEDNGPGIPSADHKKVFTRFYRGKNGQSQSGSGIGLSIVKDLTALIEGSVYLESESGKGAKFTVNLPVEPISYPLLEIEKQEPQALSVLICDDDKDIQSFLRLNLQDDFKVYTADNGIEGLQICYDQNPDIVLADVMMPLKGGIEMLKELKANKLYAHIPVVLISAKSSGENRLEGLKAGADAYIKKPFNTEELLFTLKNITSTIHKALNEFKSGVKSAKAFDERIKSTNEYVNKAIEAVVRNIENPNYSVNELAKDLFISRSQLHRKLSNYTGFTTSGFIQMIRLEKAKDLLLTNQGNVTEIAFLCGFSSPSYFSSSFTKYFGVSPSKYAVGHVNGVNMK